MGVRVWYPCVEQIVGSWDCGGRVWHKSQPERAVGGSVKRRRLYSVWKMWRGECVGVVSGVECVVGDTSSVDVARQEECE